MQGCMEKYRNDFTIRFAQVMQENLRVWKELQAQERRSLYSLRSIGIYIFTGLMGFVPGKREREYNLDFHCGLAVVFFIASIIINISVTNKCYQDAIKRTLFPKLLQVFGNGISYKFCTINKKLLNNSELFKKEINSKSIDDSFGGTYNDVDFSIAESELTNIKKLKNGKTEDDRLFKGIIMSFKMNKEINSRVLIYSKSIFNKPPKGYEKVNLEYDKFNKKFEVWVKKVEGGATDQIEARYLLNVSFLERFMELKTSFRVSKISCSVYGDTILVLLETGKDVFELNHLFKRIDDVTQYRKLFDEFASVLSFIDVLNLASKTKL